MSVTPTPAISVDSTFASPRLQSPDSRSSSRRVSLDASASLAPHHPHSPKPPPRRNRFALRQFYGLASDPQPKGNPEEPPNELDLDSFDAQTHIETFLSGATLKELLRKENELINEIRGLDGERKALVYDNYSKLITATDTIRRMRANMEPLAPTTSTLGPAISHIAQVSASLVENIPASPVSPRDVGAEGDLGRRERRGKEVVVWALACPARIEGLVKEGRREEATRVMGVLEGVLGKWDGVKGAEELRERARDALSQEGE